MADWRTALLTNFVTGVKPVTAVADPDHLLREPVLLQRVEELGFVVLFFEDSLAFRVEYETRIRPRWDAGEMIEMVVSFDPGENDFETLPVDVLEQAKRVRLHLKDMFPLLSYDVVRRLEPRYYDALFSAYVTGAVQPMGDVLSKDFLLRHLFRVDGSLVQTEAELLHFLCRLHYTQAILPDVLAQHLEHILQDRFTQWSIGLLLRDRAAFFAFLQERWPLFIKATGGGKHLVDEGKEPMRLPGPRSIPFGHHDVRVFVDNFFADGLLMPIAWDWNDAIDQRWIRVGLLDAEERNPSLRLGELLADLVKTVPKPDAQPAEWQKFSVRWGQARFLRTKLGEAVQAAEAETYNATEQVVRGNFLSWVEQTYPRIYNIPATTPAMVHHLPGYLAKMMEHGATRRVALVLVDGLALEQWVAIRDVIKPRLPSALFDESAVFAWAPTITPISRQATFSGKIPANFADTLLETSRDEQRWRQFWSGKGLYPHEVASIAIHGNPGDQLGMEDCVSADTKVLAVTIYKVDKIMHGMQLGAAGMLSQVELWAKGSFLVDLLDLLLTREFTVLITSDHGNTEATGIGSPKQGVLCETPGERVRLFSEARFADECVAKVPGSRVWSHPGLPPAFFPVVAPAGKAFVTKGTTTVCHGGDSIQELAVPFVVIRPGKESKP